MKRTQKSSEQKISSLAWTRDGFITVSFVGPFPISHELDSSFSGFLPLDGIEIAGNLNYAPLHHNIYFSD